MTKVIYKRNIRQEDFLDSDELIFYKNNNIAFIIIKKDNNYFVRKKKVFNNQLLEERTVKTIPQVLKIL